MLRYFNFWLGIGWLMVIVLCYFSLIADPPELDIDFEYFDKVRHFIAYFILMFWFAQLYKMPKTRIAYIIFFVLMGIILEVLQGLGGVRYFEYFDMLANTLGVAFAWFITKGRANNLLLYFERTIIK